MCILIVYFLNLALTAKHLKHKKYKLFYLFFFYNIRHCVIQTDNFKMVIIKFTSLRVKKIAQNSRKYTLKLIT